jgi:preprotein translocase subunit YajC
MLNTLLNWAFGATALADAATTTTADPNAAATGDPTGGLISMLVTMGLIFAVMYFMMIRPQRKKEKKAKEMLAALKVSDRVCTIGGVYGTIVSIKDETVTLSVGQDNVKLVFARWAIRNVEDVSVENDSEVLA